MWSEEWEEKFLFSLNILNEPECLACCKVLKTATAFSLNRHYERCKMEFKSLSGKDRARMLIKLKQDFRIRNLRTQAKCASSKYAISKGNNQLKATYAVTLALARKGRPFEDGEFFKEICSEVLPLFGEAGLAVGNAVSYMPLSPATITRRTEDIGLFIEREAKERLKNAKFVSVCFSDCKDICNITQMIICVRSVDNSFNTFEEILKLESFPGNISGEGIYDVFNKHVLSIVEIQKISAICIGGSSAMADLEKGFIGILKKNGIHVTTFQSVFRQELLFSASLGLKEGMETVIKTINRLREYRNNLTHKQLIVFLKDIDAEYGEEVRWLNHGKFLTRFLSLRYEIEVFLQDCDSTKNANILNSLKCHNFLYDISFLADMTQHINDLNVVLQKKDINITELLHAINMFLRKLITLRNEIDCQNLTHFPKIQEIFTQFPDTEILQVLIEELNQLLENFQISFNELLSLEWIIDVYNNPLTCSTENLPHNIVAELSLMRQNVFVPMGIGIDFWKNISAQEYPTIRDLILNIFSMFTSTYICQSAFSVLPHIKNKPRIKLTNSHLETLLKIKLYHKEIDVDKMMASANTDKQT